MVERPPLGRAPRFQLGSGGQVRAPCPFALFIADDFKPRVAVSFLGDPKLGRSDGLRQMQQLGVATKVQKHAHLLMLRFLSELEDEVLSEEWLRMMVTRMTTSEAKLPSCRVNGAGAVQDG